MLHWSAGLLHADTCKPTSCSAQRSVLLIRIGLLSSYFAGRLLLRRRGAETLLRG